jgi:hypothetical protein
MKYLNVKSIILGCLADIAGTALFSIAFGMMTTIRATLRGVDAEATSRALIEWSSTIHGIAFSLFFGLFFTGLGGYVAARVAKNGTLLNSAFVGSMGILFGLIFMGSSPIMVTIMSLTLSIPIALIGGYLYTGSWKFY